jgi:hypothetical protein
MFEEKDITYFKCVARTLLNSKEKIVINMSWRKNEQRQYVEAESGRKSIF